MLKGVRQYKKMFKEINKSINTRRGKLNDTIINQIRTSYNDEAFKFVEIIIDRNGMHFWGEDQACSKDKILEVVNLIMAENKYKFKIIADTYTFSFDLRIYLVKDEYNLSCLIRNHNFYGADFELFEGDKDISDKIDILRI